MFALKGDRTTTKGTSNPIEPYLDRPCLPLLQLPLGIQERSQHKSWINGENVSLYPGTQVRMYAILLHQASVTNSMFHIGWLVWSRYSLTMFHIQKSLTFSSPSLPSQIHKRTLLIHLSISFSSSITNNYCEQPTIIISPGQFPTQLGACPSFDTQEAQRLHRLCASTRKHVLHR